MAFPVLLQPNFDLGFQRDASRDQLPNRAAYDLVDYIIRNGAPLRKRGGWGLASKDLNALSASTRLSALGWAPYSVNPRLLMISDTHKLFESTGAIDSATGSLVGDCAVVPTWSPFWHKDRMILTVGADQGGAIDPRKYDGTTLAAIPNSPPRARVGASYGDYLVLANGYDPSSGYALRTNRIWISNLADPDTFNTTASGGIWDMPDEVVGCVPLTTMIVVFGYQKTWTLLGDTPPPGGNWTRRDLFPNLGCMDGRSIALYRDFVVWANATGIYRADGAGSLADLTASAGISTYWRTLVKNFNFGNGWKAAAGVLYGHYIITVTDNTGANVVTLMINIDDRVAIRLANMKTMMYAQRSGGPGTALESGSEELFMAWYGGPRAGRLSGLWSPTAANSLDGDGVQVLPVVETPYYKMAAQQEKRIRRVYASYELITDGGNPTIAVGYATSPELTTYTEVADQLPATTKLRHRAVDIRNRAVGLSLRFRQTASSADTRLGEIEFEGHHGEGSR